MVKMVMGPYLAIEEGEGVDGVLVEVLVLELRRILEVSARGFAALSRVVGGEIADLLVELQVIAPQRVDLLLHVGQLIPQLTRLVLQLRDARLESIPGGDEMRYVEWMNGVLIQCKMMGKGRGQKTIPLGADNLCDRRDVIGCC